ncbi:MAG TPA: NADH:flavin oxidoreductase [Myxococcaceae bacterium]|jgi:2,4-dienoyl-CoA reductase-like NADH-dependent reductase (Old Yellow Enzyme family)|nr:NADH:flavin oxidoreductase [Myxococcaceae bacterium]
MSRAFTPFTLGPLRLRNRIVKAATFEGMCPGGIPSAALVEHHRRVATGGAAMTTVAYASVSPAGRSYATQLLLGPEAVPGLRRLTEAVHREGAAASLQIGHCGDFADRRLAGGRPMGPSRRLNIYGRSLARAMSEADIARVIDEFAAAARIADGAGFDAIELHFGHGYLVSQFLSPGINRRRDRWGGSPENRSRLAVQIVRAVRAAAQRQVLLCKVNLRDGFPGGLEIDGAIETARRLETEGVQALVLSCGFVSRAPLYMLRGNVPLRAMMDAQRSVWARAGLFLFGKLLVQEYPYEEAFLRPDALRMRAAVRLPLMLLGGLKSLATVDRALDDGFELVGMGRALLHDSDLPRRMQLGETTASGCVPCNECIAEMDRGGVRCTRAPSGPGH